jgi:hypothetical protein
MGAPIDPKRCLPAVIILQLAGEAPCSEFLQVARDCQAVGFRRYIFGSANEDQGAIEPAPLDPVHREQKNTDLPVELRAIPIVLWADGRGLIGRVELGELDIRGFEPLCRELTSMLNDPELPFDQARLEVDPRLKCSEMMRVVNFLSRWNVTTISFSAAELKADP